MYHTLKFLRSMDEHPAVTSSENRTTEIYMAGQWNK